MLLSKQNNAALLIAFVIIATLITNVCYASKGCIEHLYATHKTSIALDKLNQSNSLKNASTFYSRLLDSEIQTSVARIIIMVNSDKGRLKKMLPNNNYLRGKKGEIWYWHCFMLYSGQVFDNRFEIKPCNLSKYFCLIWGKNKELKNYSIYSIQMKNLINFMNIKRKSSNIYFNYVAVNSDYLIAHPYHISNKR